MGADRHDAAAAPAPSLVKGKETEWVPAAAVREMHFGYVPRSRLFKSVEERYSKNKSNLHNTSEQLKRMLF